MQFAGAPTEFLREELAEFAGDEAVIHTDGADLGATTAEVATVGEFGQTGNGLPVEIHVAIAPLSEGFLLHVLLVDAAEDFGTEVGAIHFVFAGHFVQVASGGAGVALGAEVHGGVQHGEAGPVVFRREELAHTVEETVHHFLFFGDGLRSGDEQHVDVVEKVAVLFLLGVGNGLPLVGFVVHRHGTEGIHIDGAEHPFLRREVLERKFLRRFHAKAP